MRPMRERSDVVRFRTYVGHYLALVECWIDAGPDEEPSVDIRKVVLVNGEGIDVAESLPAPLADRLEAQALEELAELISEERAEEELHRMPR